jgi:hypothetical protein
VRPLRDHLQREVASLYAFVESVSRACSPPPQSVSYSESSSRFFAEISRLAEHTKKHIAGFEHHAEDNNEEFVEARTELWTLRAAWRELHQFIKSSADADTLNQPGAIVTALVNRLHELRGFESTQFTIFHTDSFEYAQLDPRATENLVAQLARIVDAGPFPADLGLIGMPNSQGNALFLNCLLAHEIGEYAYAKRNIEATLAPYAAVALEKYMGEAFTRQTLAVQSRVRNTLLRLAKEIFCDLFAVRLIGPCYCFAYIELFDMTNLLDKNGVLAVGENAKPPLQSYRDHPSHPFRIKEQARLLKREGWWDLIADLDSRQYAVLRELADLDENAFIKAESSAGGAGMPYVQGLLDLLPQVNQQIGDVTYGLDPNLLDYATLWKPIGEYLRNGIVPSTLNVKNSDALHQDVNPTAITLLNASYRFYLEGVEVLMSGIKGQDPASSSDRTTWMKRIESWTAKALEDIALINGSKS